MFSAQSLLVGNGVSVTCLRESREPITTLNVATYVTPLVVRNFWLCGKLFLACKRKDHFVRMCSPMKSRVHAVTPSDQGALEESCPKFNQILGSKSYLSEQ